MNQSKTITAHPHATLSIEAIKQIAREFGRKSGPELAKEIGVSRQKINYTVTYLRKAGVKIPHFRKFRQLTVAVEELKKESPELF